MQEILSETAKIVHGERNVKLKYQFQELDWLTLEGWINYLDVLTGKTIGDFRKPIDLAAKIGQNHELRAGIRHWTEEQQRITRAMLAGKLKMGSENLGQSTARSLFFTARYVRAVNSLPTDIRCLNLNSGTYEDKLKFKSGTRGYFQLHQKFF